MRLVPTSFANQTYIEPDWHSLSLRRANRRLFRDDPSHTSNEWQPYFNRHRSAENYGFGALGVHMDRDRRSRSAVASDGLPRESVEPNPGMVDFNPQVFNDRHYLSVEALLFLVFALSLSVYTLRRLFFRS